MPDKEYLNKSCDSLNQQMVSRTELDHQINEWKMHNQEVQSIEGYHGMKVKKGQMGKLDHNKEAFDTLDQSPDNDQQQAL